LLNSRSEFSRSLQRRSTSGFRMPDNSHFRPFSLRNPPGTLIAHVRSTPTFLRRQP
jgi:hypothetical protein